MRALQQVVKTLDHFYKPGCSTLVTAENPGGKGRFHNLPEIKRLAQSGWQSFEADHCAMRDEQLDPNPFPQKPTRWLVLGQPSCEPIPRCQQQCSCRLDNGRHRLVICRPHKNNPLDPRQKVLTNIFDKYKIPQGAFRYLWHAHVNNALAAHPATDMNIACEHAHDAEVQETPAPSRA